MNEWLPMDLAARKFGYSSAVSLRRRLRQLRDQGKVVDLGAVPEGLSTKSKGPIQILWANPKSMMLAADAPADLLNPARGRR